MSPLPSPRHFPAAPRAVLFDLDGTLIDSLPDLTDAVNRMLAAWHRPPLPAPAVMRMVGDGAITLVERAFAATGGAVAASWDDLLAAFLADYEPRAAETTRPWPGVTYALARLRGAGLPLAICTNKPAGATREVLDKLNLAGWFDLVVSSDDAPALKPDPAHVRVCLDRLGVGAEAAVMVGDSENDFAAAHAAGVATVAVSFGYARAPLASLEPDRVIDHFHALPAVLGIDPVPPELAGLAPAFATEMARDRQHLAALCAAAGEDAGAALAEQLHATRGKCAMFGQAALAEALHRLEQERGQAGRERFAATLDALLAGAAVHPALTLTKS
ncbi:phosphoglycolate phosphatase [Phaeospirillum tilakii]|uniref:Phosphoglycolate phosphatase n=1 Tax=Phaeospirillum tilakii TaxID=741673 RepID=A0ABW5C9C8_9PROT